jgi:predicted esterase
MRYHLRTLVTVLVFLLSSKDSASAADVDQAVKISREFLASRDPAERKRLAGKLNEYAGAIEPVIAALSARSFNPVKAGYHPEQRFSVPELRTKHPDDLLYFNVPKNYMPERPTGLIVFMHGGGNTSSRRAPRVFMSFPEEGKAAESSQLGDVFAATGMVAVGPSAPWDEDSSYRWCLRASDEYLADVIQECKSRFNIDADRVFLIGHSMGGFGAYHHIQRQPDRFAAVIVNAGSWSLSHFPAIRGTPLCIIQGVHDARAKERWHYTDVEYARWTDRLLTARQLDHTYYEHDGKHAVSYGKEYIAKYLASAKSLRRDAYYPHVVLVSSVGFKRSYSSPVEHNRWLTLDETSEGAVEYDELVTNGAEDFDRWRLKHQVTQRRGSVIDAVNNGDNTITVSTTNVARFTIWLHPRMVDASKPVTVVVNGKTCFADRVKPSLAIALESYERRGDWKLVYHVKLAFVVRP